VVAVAALSKVLAVVAPVGKVAQIVLTAVLGRAIILVVMAQQTQVRAVGVGIQALVLTTVVQAWLF
jgi:hypothetical protein